MLAETLGEKLHKMFKEHGSFSMMEMAVKKWHKQQTIKNKQGGWYTKHFLATNAGWTKW